MNFIINIGRSYPPVVTVTDTDWAQGGQLWALESLGKENQNF